MADVIDNPAQERFELPTDDGVAFAAYTHDGGEIAFVHTLVPEGEQGHGVGKQLIAGAMAIVRQRGLKVVAQCPFVAAWFDDHPEERDLLA